MKYFPALSQLLSVMKLLMFPAYSALKYSASQSYSLSLASLLSVLFYHNAELIQSDPASLYMHCPA